jgi:sterol 3beta-glucosyltransferase
MRITLVAIGSRGDVQPLVALGIGLMARGHQVRLVAGDEFSGFVNASGVPFQPLGLSMQKAMEMHTDVFEFMNSMRDRIAGCVTEDQQAVVSTFLGVSCCPVARARRIPFFYALPIPSIQTREFANPLFPPLPFGGRYNALTHRLAEKHICNGYEDARSLFCEPRPTYLCCYSPEVVPRPRDWGPHIRVTGYWFLPRMENYEPPVGLREFLGAGDAAVAVSLGSGKPGEAEWAMSAATKAVLATGRRAVVLTAGRRTQVAGPRCYAIESVPFEWLLPRVAAAVHHGGAGTTAAAIRAGIPSVVLPFGLDQAYWGRRVKELGVGLGPFDFWRSSQRTLASAVSRVAEEKGMRLCAQELGQKIEREDGVGNAVSTIEEVQQAW